MLVGTEKTVPWSSGGYAVTVAACNLLGGGPAVAHGGVKGPTVPGGREMSHWPRTRLGDVVDRGRRWSGQLHGGSNPG
jgi:hypothetical protein